MIISIFLRNQYEDSNHRHSERYLTIGNLRKIVNQYNPRAPLAKMDQALINMQKLTKFVGDIIITKPEVDYPYYHCSNAQELSSVLIFLHEAGYLASRGEFDEHDLHITAKGYQRLREIAKPGKDSKQCFVAMWFAEEMNDVYENAIKKAIEYIEEGESSARFEAIKIDDVEHTNDINDEIIAQIRRSRFMVCDLTGYRGGVYFEAGFAYGLGLEVIYTCREDWCKEQVLKDENDKEVLFLLDNNKNEVFIKKEGVHFDIAHRNRIEWSPDNLDEFRIKLENRIKSVII